MNAVADAMERLNGIGWSASDAINSIAGASDNAGGALGNLAGTGVSTCQTIQGAFDGLSNAIYGVANQIVGSLS